MTKEKKALGTPPTLPPINQGSREESSICEGGSRSETFDQPHFIPKGQSFPMGSQYPLSIPSKYPPAPTLPHNSPQYQQPAPLAQTTPNYNHQQAGQSDKGPTGMPVPLHSPTNRASQQVIQAESRMLSGRQTLGHSSMDHRQVSNIFGHNTLWLYKTRSGERRGRRLEDSLYKETGIFNQG